MVTGKLVSGIPPAGLLYGQANGSSQSISVVKNSDYSAIDCFLTTHRALIERSE